MRIGATTRSVWNGGPESTAWTLDGGSIAVTISSLGAHICELTMPDGRDRIDVTIGYPSLGARPVGFHGASVGRYANRIAGARFELDGTQYELEPNEGSNQLHGGPCGFDQQTWIGDAEAVGDTARIELRHRSPAGDQGFPGTVEAEVVYELSDSRLRIAYRATADAPTPVNLTNHTYWNLAGSGRLAEHRLTLDADRYVAVDRDSIPVTGPPLDVGGTRFDCRTGRDLGDVEAAGGFDHCFLPAATEDGAVRPIASLTHRSGRRLAVSTDQIGVQVYTGNHLSADRRGVALETQYLPDTPNRPDFGDATLRPGEVYESITDWEFGW